MHCTIQLGNQLLNSSKYYILMITILVFYINHFTTYIYVLNCRKRYVNQYNVSVRFLATQGGLSRWQHILDLAEDKLYVQHTEYNIPIFYSLPFFRQFGDVHNRSVEEDWYKRPVLYRNLNPQAFVFSVPFNSGIQLCKNNI